MPSLSSGDNKRWSKPSSAIEQIIPLDSCPRMVLCLITKPSPKSHPGLATITFCPAATFGAPQTIWVTSPGLTSTWQTCKWSLSGWSIHSLT